MDAEQTKYGFISIVLALVAIVMSWNAEYFILSLVLGSIAVVFGFLSSYVKQIKANTNRIDGLEKERDIDKRLIKVEDFMIKVEKRLKI